MVHRKVQYKRIPKSYMLSCPAYFQGLFENTWNHGDGLSNLEASFIHKAPHNSTSKISVTSSDLSCNIQEKSKDPQPKPNQARHIYTQTSRKGRFFNLRDLICQLRLGSEKQKEE